MMEEVSKPSLEPINAIADIKLPDDERSNNNISPTDNQPNNGTIRTLDGEVAGDELEGDAINYQILLGKIDALLHRLKLDA